MAENYDTVPASFLGAAMAKVGLLPPNCISFELVAGGPDEPLCIKFTVCLTVENMKALAKAQASVVEEMEKAEEEQKVREAEQFSAAAAASEATH